MKNKRGDVDPFVLSLILGMILVGVLFWFTTAKAKEPTLNYLDIQACQNSVNLNAKKIGAGGQDIFIPDRDLQCPTVYKEIKDVKEVKPVIADQLYDCWTKFHKGQIRFFPQETKRLCIVCSRINFADKARGTEVLGFTDYLRERKIPLSKETYFDYLGGYGTNLEDIQKEIDKRKDAGIPDSINTNLDYYTLFVVYSKDELSKFETGTVSAVATGALVYGGLIALYMAFPPAALASGAILTAVNSFAATATVGTAVVTSFKYGYAFGDAEGIDWKAKLMLIPTNNVEVLEQCDELKIQN